MAIATLKKRTPEPQAEAGPPLLRPITQQPQWSLTEYICSAGPDDRPFEERHERVSMALVTSGTFCYRTDTGEGILYPGALLLGNAGACYECGHEHSHGDRCLALLVEQELFSEIASGASGSNRCQFRTAILPASSGLASVSISLQQPSPAQLAREESVLAFIETVVRAVATNHTPPRRPGPSASRRLSRVMDFIESHLAADLTLADMAGLAAMSKYHFLRSFKRVTGLTPHQYVMSRRLRRAATALRATSKTIAQVAADQGFGDLSTFNHAFHRTMGVKPSVFRSGL